MPKYHLSPKTGNPGVCKAKYKCAFGDIETEHYETVELARAAFEDKMRSQSVTSSRAVEPFKKFEEILRSYKSHHPKLSSQRTSKDAITISSDDFKKSVLYANSSGDMYFYPESIRVRSKPGSLSMSATDTSNNESVFFYVNLQSGMCFYGDDPEDEARDDRTFRTVFGVIHDPKSVSSIADTMLDLYEDREAKAGSWDSDRDSIKFSYVNYGHHEVNDALRSGSGLSPEYLATLDEISREDTLDKPVTVYRGVPKQAAGSYLNSIKDGVPVVDSALLSTTIDPSVAQNFARRDGYVLEIQLPKGQKCLNLSQKGNEGEILLPRSTSLDNVRIFRTKVGENA